MPRLAGSNRSAAASPQATARSIGRSRSIRAPRVPRSIKGVIAARGERFSEARDLWRKAKELDPNYPNIDRLIEEAGRDGRK